MCEKLSNNKEEMLDKLKEEWEKDNNIGENTINKSLNTDVSIQIHMDDDPKPTNIVDTYPNDSIMDGIIDDLDQKFHEPHFYDIYADYIYYDVNDDNNTSPVNPNNMDVPSKVQIELDVNKKTIKENFPIGDVWVI
ncbi:erythrocyte membrane protein 1, EMP1, fragment [Plasmodium reichenowi]|uniref:Erythrocyte membrane protein 1, EMP1 n=1 Tax=Plasmodium reichenowi TaxID=5854 RepID=A0A060RME7_PLARE|nr:erythrocyte membrane protein 1, EMP1, fragment [Plasmodium reichenowi]